MTETPLDFRLIAADVKPTFGNVRAARQSFIAATTSIGNLWNGPICPTCRCGYIGAHTCSAADLRAQIERLRTLIAALDPVELPHPDDQEEQ